MRKIAKKINRHSFENKSKAMDRISFSVEDEMEHSFSNLHWNQIYLNIRRVLKEGIQILGEIDA